MKLSRKLWMGVTAVVLGGVALFGCQASLTGNKAQTSQTAPAAPPTNAPAPEASAAPSASVDDTTLKNVPVPDFDLPTIDGGKMALASVRGKKPVIINFFATDCPACNMEIPHLQKFYEKYKDKGLTVIAISTEAPETLIPFVKRKGMTYSILTDRDGQVTTRYGAEYIPASLVLDEKGQAVSGTVGFSEEDFDAKIVKPIEAIYQKQAMR